MPRLVRSAATAASGVRPSFASPLAEPLEGRRLLAANLQLAQPLALPFADPPVAWGESFTVQANVRNSGDATVGRSVARLYLSADATITADDTLIAEQIVPELRPGATHLAAPEVRLPTLRPDGLPASGTLRVGAILDPTNRVAETSEADNTTVFWTAPLAVSGGSAGAARANLVFAAPPTVSPTLNPNSAFTVSYTVRNAGTAASLPASVDVYLSGDGQFDPLDVLIGQQSDAPLAPTTFKVPALAPGQSVTRQFTNPLSGVAGLDPYARIDRLPFAVGSQVTVGAVIRPPTVDAPGGQAISAESNTRDNRTRFYVGTTTLGAPTFGNGDNNDQLIEAVPLGTLPTDGILSSDPYAITTRTDVDIFSIDVPAAGRRVHAWTAMLGGVGLSLLDARGNTLASATHGAGVDLPNAGGNRAQLGYTFAQPGRYYVAVSAGNLKDGVLAFDPRYGYVSDRTTGGNATDAYSLIVRGTVNLDLDGSTDAGDANDQLGEAYNLGTFPAGTSRIVYSADLRDDFDVDAYRFTVNSVNRQVNVRATTLAGLVRVYDAAGNVVASAADAYLEAGGGYVPTDAVDFTFTTGAAGTYYVLVGDVDNDEYNPFTGTGDTNSDREGRQSYELYVTRLNDF